MTSPLSEKPRRWDDLLGRARDAAQGSSAALALVRELADALEEERDNLDSSREYNETQEAVLHDAALEIERLNDKLHEADIEGSAPLRDRLERVVRDWVDTDQGVLAPSNLSPVVNTLMRVIATEVSARVSEAQVAVPEPLAVGTFAFVASNNADPPAHMLTVHVGGDAPSIAPATEVGIWHASLAEQVADRELDLEGTQRTLAENEVLRRRLDLLKESFDTDDPVAVGKAFDSLASKLDAMTAVAKRALDGWRPKTDADGCALWTSDQHYTSDDAVTDAERRALEVLSEGESDHG